MGKVTNSKIGIIFLAIVICIGGTLLFRMLFHREVNAVITPADIVVGGDIHYMDSTNNAREWLWEFGDGGKSVSNSGTYVTRHPGLLSIRLTVDNKLTKTFLVTVREHAKNKTDNIISMNVPDEGIQGEYVTFRGLGQAKEWRWEFGETHKIDSRDQVAIYAYTQPGVYEVLLSTETTEYPVRHTIKIIPNAINDTTDMQLVMGNDIKEKLQAIVNGQSFNTNYNYILSKYLDNNPNIPVVVNNTKDGNSFWSYCQGLKIVGRGVTTIQSVVVDIVDENSVKVSKLIVMQETKK
jgi:PKD repeat protein